MTIFLSDCDDGALVAHQLHGPHRRHARHCAHRGRSALYSVVSPAEVGVRFVHMTQFVKGEGQKKRPLASGAGGRRCPCRNASNGWETPLFPEFKRRSSNMVRENLST